MTWAAKGAEREKRSRALLSQRKKRLTTKDFINILRDHGNNPQWTPNRGPGATLCLHAADKLLRRTQTVCSLIAKIGKDRNFFYTTGASNSCISPFFPCFFPLIPLFLSSMLKEEKIMIQNLIGGRVSVFTERLC